MKIFSLRLSVAKHEISVHGENAKSIILLRTASTDAFVRFELIKDVLDKAVDKFIVVTEGKIRIRALK